MLIMRFEIVFLLFLGTIWSAYGVYPKKTTTGPYPMFSTITYTKPAKTTSSPMVKKTPYTKPIKTTTGPTQGNDAMTTAFTKATKPDTTPMDITVKTTTKTTTTIKDPCIKSKCHKYATCIPLGIKYKCKCKKGLEGNGYRCKPYCAAGSANPGINLPIARKRRFIDIPSISIPSVAVPDINIPEINIDSLRNLSVNVPNIPVFTFPRTSLGKIASSEQMCVGVPCAQADCIKDKQNPSRAIFKIKLDSRSLQCGGSVASIVSEMGVSSLTVDKAVKCLQYVTTNKDLSAEEAVRIVDTLYDLIHHQSFDVSQELLQTLMDLVNQVASIVWEQNPTTSVRKEMQKLVEVMEEFAVRLNLPAQKLMYGAAPVFSTNDIIMQVVDLTQSAAFSAFDHSTQFKDFSGTESAISIELPNSLLKKAYQAMNTSDLRVSYIVYQSDLFFPSENNISKVACANIQHYNSVEDLEDPVTVTFNQETARQGKSNMQGNPFLDIVTSTSCVLWDENNLTWTRDGCQLVLGSWPPQCRCSRLANFAMLVSVDILPAAFIMGIVSYVGCSLSILGLLITMCVFLAVKELRERKSTMFIVNISVCLLIVNVLFIGGTSRIENRITCYITTALLHYFLLATWFWMTCNAVNMYIVFVKVIQTENLLRPVAAVVSYLFPLAIVLTTVGLTVLKFDIQTFREDDILFESTYNARHVCWLHSYSLNYGFLVPVGVMTLINLVIFCLVIQSLTCKKPKVRSSLRKQTKSQEIMKAFQLVILMGLTWIFGFLLLIANNEEYRLAMAWLFTIFNSTQGFLLFYVNCVRNGQVRKLWLDPCLRTVCCLERPQTQTSFNQLRTISTSKT